VIGFGPRGGGVVNLEQQDPVVVIQNQYDEVTPGSDPDQPKATTQAVLVDAGFTEVTKHELSVPYVWEIDQFIGYLCSTSFSSRDFWGEAWAGFERDLRRKLAALAPTGLLADTLSAYFVVGRKP
jgi:hypothetical protein